jgi:hypothetical protein
LVATGLAAFFWLIAAAIGVRNQIDNFISDLRRSGRWYTAGALAACIAFTCDFAIRWMQ